MSALDRLTEEVEELECEVEKLREENSKFEERINELTEENEELKNKAVKFENMWLEILAKYVLLGGT